jgi:hypothetical protein
MPCAPAPILRPATPRTEHLRNTATPVARSLGSGTVLALARAPTFLPQRVLSSSISISCGPFHATNVSQPPCILGFTPSGGVPVHISPGPCGSGCGILGCVALPVPQRISPWRVSPGKPFAPQDCTRMVISEFASLVRKSYSGVSSGTSTLVPVTKRYRVSRTSILSNRALRLIIVRGGKRNDHYDF